MRLTNGPADHGGDSVAGGAACADEAGISVRPERSETIHYALGQSSLGGVLVARTAKGICAVLLGEDFQMLKRDLRTRFPQAVLMPGGMAVQDLLGRVTQLIEAPAKVSKPRLSLDAHGTPFQRRVWDAPLEIPVGKTASYTEIARRIGAPNAVRAVAQACGANSIAVAIPCHRVVRNDGELSGYRWGVERKRTLLAREGVDS